MESPTHRGIALVLNRDLLFGSRIRSALAGLGMEPRFAGTSQELVSAMDELGDACAIVIIDMNGAVDWPVIEAALASAGDPPPTLAFGPHVDVDMLRAAKSAGVSRVVSNGQFTREMTQLVERYRR